mgnify:CR=1 FL=1
MPKKRDSACYLDVFVYFVYALKFVKHIIAKVIRQKRHRKQHSGEPCRQQAIVRGPSKRSTAIIFFQNCRTQCDPQHPTNSRKDWSGKFVTAEGCCKATREQKEQTTDFVSAGRFWCFLSGKKHVKKDLRFNVSERLRLRTAVEYDSNATMSTLIFYWAHEILRDCVPVVVLLSNRLPTIIPA